MNTKQIAERLMENATHYPWHCGEGARAEFYIDGLTIRCTANRAAIEAVAAKYAKGINKRWMYRRQRNPTITRGRFSTRVFNALIVDRELDNAFEYAGLFDELQLTQKDLQAIQYARRLYDH